MNNTSPWYFNRNILLIVSVFFCGLSLYISTLPNHKDLFSSSGALITVAGLFLNIKHTMVFHLKIPLISKYHMKDGAFGFGTSELTDDQKKFISNILTDEKYGVAFMLVGTLIWAYGVFLVEFLQCT